METLNDINIKWLDHHKKTFTYKGKRYKIHATSARAIFPYEHRSISVHAEDLDPEDEFSMHDLLASPETPLSLAAHKHFKIYED